MTKGTEKEIRFVCIREDGTYITSRTMQHVSRVIHNDLNIKDFDYHSLRHPYVKLKLKFLLTQHYRCIGAKVLDYPLNFKPVVGVNIHLVYKHICECLCQGVFLFRCFCYLQVF